MDTRTLDQIRILAAARARRARHDQADKSWLRRSRMDAVGRVLAYVAVATCAVAFADHLAGASVLADLIAALQVTR